LLSAIEATITPVLVHQRSSCLMLIPSPARNL